MRSSNPNTSASPRRVACCTRKSTFAPRAFCLTHRFALLRTYASKSNQLKQLVIINSKLQNDAQSARERELEAVRESEKHRAEGLKFKQKCKEQTDRFKDTFAQLEKVCFSLPLFCFCPFR